METIIGLLIGIGLSAACGFRVFIPMLGDISPFLKWSLAIIADGGVSAVVQGGTIAFRASSTGTTGGMANFLLSTGELLGSTLITVFAILLPVICFFVVILISFLMIMKMARSGFIKNFFTLNKHPLDF